MQKSLALTTALLALLICSHCEAGTIYNYTPSGLFTNSTNFADFTPGVHGIVSASAEFSDVSAGTRAADSMTAAWSHSGGIVSFDTEADTIAGGFFIRNSATFDSNGQITDWDFWFQVAKPGVGLPNREGFKLLSGGTDDISSDANTLAGEVGRIDNTNRFGAAASGTWTSTAVPEPSSVAFLGLGAIGACLRRKRKRDTSTTA